VLSPSLPLLANPAAEQFEAELEPLSDPESYKALTNLDGKLIVGKEVRWVLAFGRSKTFGRGEARKVSNLDGYQQTPRRDFVRWEGTATVNT
jgi:hypothetical protein